MNGSNQEFDLIVVGGGAAGFFGAIQAAEMRKGIKVAILEKSNKLLAKVKVSGGGRCNVTHHCLNPIELSHHYPRGEKSLKSIFKVFDAVKTKEWFESKGVKLKVEQDGRMFPTTDDSQTIVDCFLEEAERLKISILLGQGVSEIKKDGYQFVLRTQPGDVFRAKKVLLATGGNPSKQAYDWLELLGHHIIPPIPSLFTFNDVDKKFTDLMGLAVTKAEIKIAGSNFSQVGPVLITHWGLSGPAVIKLSAWAATYLHEKQYTFTALVSWIGPVKETDVRSQLLDHKNQRGKQKVFGNPLYGLPVRLWERICALSEIDDHKIWAELPQKNINRLMEFLIRCPFQIRGKTTFKEEFVTCGGVDLKDVNIDSMESKILPGLFFAGEVLNIDGETGGFNFQAAWSTSYLAARSMFK